MKNLTRKLKWLQNTHPLACYRNRLIYVLKLHINIRNTRLQNTHLRLVCNTNIGCVAAAPATYSCNPCNASRVIHLKAPQLWILGGFCKEPNVMRFQEIQPWCRPSNKLHDVTIIRLFGSLPDDMDSMTFVIPPYSFRHFRDSTRFREHGGCMDEWMDGNYCFLLDSSSLANHGGQLGCRF
jgi:hypothetical protein